MKKLSYSKLQKIFNKPEGNVSARVVESYKNSYYELQDALDLQVTAEVVGKTLIFTTKGRWMSLNFIISKPSWATEINMKDVIKGKARAAVAGLDIKLERFKIVLRYNSRMDDHNTVMMPKFFTDAIKTTKLKNNENRLMEDDEGNTLYEYVGIIEDDYKKYSRGTHLDPDESLPHNTYVLMYIPDDEIMIPFEKLKQTFHDQL